MTKNSIPKSKASSKLAKAVVDLEKARGLAAVFNKEP